jgi:hypothetical protein
LEVLGHRGTIADVVALLVVGYVGSRTIEESGIGAFGATTVVQQLTSVLRKMN